MAENNSIEALQIVANRADAVLRVATHLDSIAKSNTNSSEFSFNVLANERNDSTKQKENDENLIELFNSAFDDDFSIRDWFDQHYTQSDGTIAFWIPKIVHTELEHAGFITAYLNTCAYYDDDD